MFTKIEGIYCMIISSFKYTRAEMLIKSPKIWNMLPEGTSSSHLEIQKYFKGSQG